LCVCECTCGVALCNCLFLLTSYTSSLTLFFSLLVRSSFAAHTCSNVRVSDVASRYELRGGRGPSTLRVQTKRYPSSPTVMTHVARGRGRGAPGRGGSSSASASSLAVPSGASGGGVRRTTVGANGPNARGGGSVLNRYPHGNRALSPDPPRTQSPGSFRFCSQCGTPSVGASKFCGSCCTPMG
jgi:hypothetical protein